MPDPLPILESAQRSIERAIACHLAGDEVSRDVAVMNAMLELEELMEVMSEKWA